MALHIDDLFRAGKRDDAGRLKNVILLGGRDGQQPAGLPNAQGTIPKEGPRISLLPGEWELLRSIRKELELQWGVVFEPDVTRFGNGWAKAEAKTLLRLLLRCFDPKHARRPACLGSNVEGGEGSAPSFVAMHRLRHDFELKLQAKQEEIDDLKRDMQLRLADLALAESSISELQGSPTPPITSLLYIILYHLTCIS